MSGTSRFVLSRAMQRWTRLSRATLNPALIHGASLPWTSIMADPAFPSRLPLRADRLIEAQPYGRLGSEDYVNRYGRTVSLQVWASCCATCGEPFTFTALADRDDFNRRCREHRRPGVHASRPWMLEPIEGLDA
jgi:hypothetical protein